MNPTKVYLISIYESASILATVIKYFWISTSVDEVTDTDKAIRTGTQGWNL